MMYGSEVLNCGARDAQVKGRVSLRMQFLATLGVDARRDPRGGDRQQRFNGLILARLLAAGGWHTARDSLDYSAVAHVRRQWTYFYSDERVYCARNAPRATWGNSPCVFRKMPRALEGHVIARAVSRSI
jgi:hypothetical protein